MLTKKVSRALSISLSVVMAWAVLIGSAALPTPALALGAIITVTTAADNTTTDGQCSLREAITNANNNAATYTDCGTGLAGGTGDMIVFSSGLGTATIRLGSTLPAISDTTGLNIDGGGIITLSGDTDGNGIGDVQLFSVGNNVPLTLQNLTMERGRSIDPVWGGAVTSSGKLTLQNVLVRNNSSTGVNAQGGAINQVGGTLTIKASTFKDNTAVISAAAIRYSAGTILIQDSTFMSNTTTDPGSTYGAISGDGSPNLTIQRSTFGTNVAKYGGAIYFSDGSLSIENSTFSGNGYATSGLAGAIYASNGTVTIKNSTIADNLTNGMIIGSTATLNISNTILANSTSYDCYAFAGAVLGSATHNIIGTLPGSTDNCGLTTTPITSLGLAALANNGGPSPTRALLPGSQAIDAGDNLTCLSTDQRGDTRPLDGNGDGTATCDIGAYEVRPASSTSIFSDAPNPSLSGATLGVYVSVTSASGFPTGTVNISMPDSSCVATLVSGSGTCNLHPVAVGAQTITATYVGDLSHDPSTVTKTHNVAAATTTTITAVTPDPSLSGTAVTVNVSVASASGTPSGWVNVSSPDGSCAATLAAGSGSCLLNLTTIGVQTISAVYQGDAFHLPSVNAIAKHHTVVAATTTTITSDTPDPSLSGATVPVNVSVASASGTPTGTVNVSTPDGGCIATLAAGSGSCLLNPTSSGVQTITAVYQGDSTHAMSTSTEPHTVMGSTTTTITSDTPDPSISGAGVTVVVSVSSTGSTPTGTVNVSTPDSNCAVTLAAGSGSCLLNLTTIGVQTISAVYQGDAFHLPSANAIAKHHTVVAATTTTITSDTPDPSLSGATVPVNVSVASASGTPTGTVNVSTPDGGCIATLAAGSGSCLLNPTSSGVQTITAVYQGDSTHAMSTSTEPHTVMGSTTTTITSDTPDPSISGAGVMVVVSVSSTGDTPTGTVNVSTPDSNCAVTLAAGSGSCQLTLTTTGIQTITAVYQGDSTHQTSTATKTHIVVTSTTFTSLSAQDGWVLESSKTSNKGATLNRIAKTLSLGDNAAKEQYRSILSFSTGAGLPDGAVITAVTLKVKKQGVGGGGNPLTLFQGFMVDIKKGTFGAFGLQAGDFQAKADHTYGPFLPPLVNGWYSIDLTGAANYINELAAASGLTQIRLRFKLDHNNNVVANILRLFSGNAPAASRPQLVITYYTP